MYVPHVSLISPPLLPLAAQTSTNMKTMERQDTTVRGQMELQLGKLAGRTRSQWPLANRAQSARARGQLVVRPNAAVDDGS